MWKPIRHPLIRWALPLLVGGLLTSCGLGTKTYAVGEFLIEWSNDSIRIEDAMGGEVFSSPAGQPFLSVSRQEMSHEYGSGSFTFAETMNPTCGTPEWQRPRLGETLEIEGTYVNCEATISVSFSSPRSGWLTMDVEGQGDVNRLHVRGASTAEERFTGFGAQYSGLDFKGRVLPIWCQEQGHGRGAEPITEVLSLGQGNPAGDWHTSYTCVPWMIRDARSGLLVEGTERVVFDMEEENSFEIVHSATRVALSWVQGEDLSTLMENYTAGVGRMTSFPEWTQKGVILRGHGGADDVLALVDEAEEAGVTVAAVWIEDWCGQRQTALGTRMLWNWDVDRTLYPDWEEMVEALRARNVRALAYINPYLVDASDREDVQRHLYEEARAQDFLVKNTDGDVFWMDQGGFDAALVDLTNPAATEWLQSIVEDLIDTGVSGWMADFSEGLPLDAVLYEGAAASIHNEWPERWARVNRLALENKGLWADSLVFHRSGNARSPGFARSFWLGDQITTWDSYDGLATVVPALITSGLSGFSMQHSDTGGYLSVSALGITRDGELFQRWVELSAVTPLFRMHSTNQPDENHQWNTDPETKVHLSRMIELYAALAPYRSRLMEIAAQRGLPVLRPTFFTDPTDETAWAQTEQFMLGDDVLMAPVLQPGVSEVRAYLPAGQWVHAPSGAVYDGLKTVTVSSPMGDPAIFVRNSLLELDAVLSVFETD